MNLQELLNADLDDIADLPAFEAPPPGHYKLSLTIKLKKINDKDAIEFGFVTLDEPELADASETPPKLGTSFNVAFQLGNETGEKVFKKTVKPIMEGLGTSKYADVINGQVEAMTVFATVKRRKDKHDPEKFYADVSNIVVA